MQTGDIVEVKSFFPGLVTTVEVLEIYSDGSFLGCNPSHISPQYDDDLGVYSVDRYIRTVSTKHSNLLK